MYLHVKLLRWVIDVRMRLLAQMVSREPGKPKNRQKVTVRIGAKGGKAVPQNLSLNAIIPQKVVNEMDFGQFYS